MEIISVQNLHKSYQQNKAVDDLAFSVSAGEILGLIGPNGAGKSSTIKMILDFIKPDAGKVRLFGETMNETSKEKIGYLPEAKGLYKNLTAIDCILYLASLKGIPKPTAKQRAVALLKKTGMLETQNRKIKHMSKGMGQMIQFIVTIVHDPELLIMDEPFSGLDPVNTELMRNMILELREQGKAIILSTHQMNQVEEICDRVLMINHGKEVLSGDLKRIRASYRKHSIYIEVDDELPPLDGVIEQHFTKTGVELALAEDTSPQLILDQLRKKNVDVNRFEISTPSLRGIFLDLVGNHNE